MGSFPQFGDDIRVKLRLKMFDKGLAMVSAATLKKYGPRLSRPAGFLVSSDRRAQ